MLGTLSVFGIGWSMMQIARTTFPTALVRPAPFTYDGSQITNGARAV
jgi:hypothetical protein